MYVLRWKGGGLKSWKIALRNMWTSPNSSKSYSNLTINFKRELYWNTLVCVNQILTNTGVKGINIYFQISLVSESRSRTSRSIFESRISVSENRDFITRYEIFFKLENSLILMKNLTLAKNFFTYKL